MYSSTGYPLAGIDDIEDMKRNCVDVESSVQRFVFEVLVVSGYIFVAI